MEKLVILQTRLSSSRLPGKALLPIADVPMFVMAAKRAANTGLKVIVATSNTKGDDLIAEVATRHELRIFRGPLDDVLSRVTLAASEYSDDCVIVRATADNIVPDGHLIEEVIDEFISSELNYIFTGGENCGLPYGVSVEVMWLKHLREADRFAEQKHDREHVTPYIKRKFGASEFRRHQHLGMQLYRATIDTYDDYVSMAMMFSSDRFSVETNWQEAIKLLGQQASRPIVKTAHLDFVLGSAQLGMEYGINSMGQPSTMEAKKLIETAVINGCASVDTARAYGLSERILGEHLNKVFPERVSVITKISPLENISPEATPEQAAMAVENSLLTSLLELQQHKIDTVMLHRASHLSSWDRAALNRLKELRDQGKIGVIGVSVQTPQELDYALSESDVGHIQMPFNIFDNRWDEVIERIAQAKRKRQIKIHVRSVFLQGLLLINEIAKWEYAGVSDAQSHINWLNKSKLDLKRKNVADLCVAWVRAFDWVDGVVVGCESATQFEDNVSLFEHPPLSTDEVNWLKQSRPPMPVESLNPANWGR